MISLSITFLNSTWYLVLCFIIGLLVAFWFYYKDKTYEDAPQWSRWLMAILRGTIIASLCALLLSPMVETIENESKKPIIVMAQDVSQSIFLNSISKKEEYLNEWKELQSELKADYEVVNLTFGEKTSMTPIDSFTSSTSNISECLEYIEENYTDQHIGAVILSTDGIYNEGKNPIYSANKSTPIYTVALGDTTRRKDIYIKEVYHNKIAYLGDELSIQIDIAADGIIGKKTTLSVSKSKKKISSQPVYINKSDFFKTVSVQIPTNQKGVQKYRVAITQIANETSTTNNYKDIYIEVIDGRQKVLIVADGPHPDVATFKTILDQNKNYKVDTKIASENVNVTDYDFVILHNLPSQKHSVNTLINQINKRKIGRLFIVGAQTNLNAFNKLQSVVKVSGNGVLMEDVQATLIPKFSAFTTSPLFKKRIGNYPPLSAPFGRYSNTGNVLLNQNIKGIATQYPLLTFGESQGIKTGVLTGEGIFKWKYFNYIEDKNDIVISELINKTIQLLTIKDDKRKFRVNVAKTLFKENENITFDAQLYNNNYELINTPEANLVIKSKEGKEFPFTFTRTDNYYSLNANKLPVGKYNYTGTTSYGGQSMVAKGSFTIQDIQLEQYDLVARHDILKQISAESNGSMVFPKDMGTLSDTIKSNTNIKPIIYSSTRKSLLLSKWIPLCLLLLCLVGEWFLRRFMGGY